MLDPAFLGVFAGSALVCASLVVTVVVAGGPAPLAAAATVHLAGVMGVTVVGSVPMNDALAAARLDRAARRRRWTAWNHVRTAAAVVATVVLGAAG